ncbi:hypothetical protein PT277_01940 [Acetobacteraceae bacterium ESL0709]|nr:hypothetical protein [Acetobacteraceae bacterium ESL0697]MDF7677462.1 hypothetical protein [Acetobacteraceae bacterium ESL0709]
MPLSGSALRWGGGCAALLLLSGCATHTVGPQIMSPPDPFGYEKVSALCKLSPLTTDPAGRMNVEMAVGSDEGKCALSVSKGGGGSYVSFGVDPAPEHGKAFLYNYDGRTYINYQPVTAYNGDDSFGVDLIPAHAQPRNHITVKVKIELVGAPSAAVKPVEPKVEPEKAPVTKSSGKTAVSRHGHKAVRSQSSVSKKTVEKPVSAEPAKEAAKTPASEPAKTK